MNGESDYLKEKTSLDISSTEGIPSKGTKGRFCKLMHKKVKMFLNVLGVNPKNWTKFVRVMTGSWSLEGEKGSCHEKPTAFSYRT